jgi:hypothetical protein
MRYAQLAPVALLVLVVGGATCGGVGGGEGSEPPGLAAGSRPGAAPDTVIGVLIRTRGPIDAERRAALESVGLALGTVTGELATGRIRADSVRKLQDLPFVLHVEAARSIPVPRPRIPPDTGPPT